MSATLIISLLRLIGNGLILAFVVLTVLNYSAILGYAFKMLRTYRRRQSALRPGWTQSAKATPPVCLIVPMYNEAAVCLEAARSMLAVRYPNLEIFLVNDGSSDDTHALLVEHFEFTSTLLHPTADIQTELILGTSRSSVHHNLWLIDKENGGKVDAMNAGINYCRSPLFCVVDADSLLEPDAIYQLVMPFMSDATTIASGGNIRIVNDCEVRGGHVRTVRLPKRLIPQFQVLEYMRAFVAARAGWSALRMLMIISGALGMFKRSVVVEAGAFSRATMGEDMELIFRLHRFCRDRGIPYRVAYVPDAVAWTECPESANILGKQRDRWHRGLGQLLALHKGMFLNPRYGRLGMVGFPYFLFVEFLGPLLEFLGYIALVVSAIFGWLNPAVASLLALFTVLFGVAFSMASVALEELAFRRYTRLSDVLRLLGLSLIENLGYRQMTVFFRLRGLWKLMRSDHSWGAMPRTGFRKAA